MMGVGFAVGFVQSHFEITAIAGLLMLCYFFSCLQKAQCLHLERLFECYDDRAG